MTNKTYLPLPGGPIATFFVTKVGILSGLMGWDPEDNWTTVTSAIMAGMVTNTLFQFAVADEDARLRSVWDVLSL